MGSPKCGKCGSKDPMVRRGVPGTADLAWVYEAPLPAPCDDDFHKPAKPLPPTVEAAFARINEGGTGPLVLNKAVTLIRTADLAALRTVFADALAKVEEERDSYLSELGKWCATSREMARLLDEAKARMTGKKEAPRG